MLAGVSGSCASASLCPGRTGAGAWHEERTAPRALPISAAAAEVWREFYNQIEGQCGAEKSLMALAIFAAKAAEHAARIAGVITIVEDLHAREIGRDAMEGAVGLAEWYVCEALRLKQAGRTDPKLLRAAKLLDGCKASRAVRQVFVKCSSSARALFEPKQGRRKPWRSWLRMVGPWKFRTGHASSRLLGGDPVKAYRKFKLPEAAGPLLHLLILLRFSGMNLRL
jgi:Protein of unknown function (DUF3987)